MPLFGAKIGIHRDLNRFEYESLIRVLATLPSRDLQRYEVALPFLSLSWKGRGLQLGLGILVGLPMARAPLGPATSPPPFIYVGRGHPKDRPSLLLAVCGAPLYSYTPRSYRRSA